MRDLIPSDTIVAEVQLGAAAFAYEACDIPAGMTIADYRVARSAGRSKKGLRARFAAAVDGLKSREDLDRVGRPVDDRRQRDLWRAPCLTSPKVA